MLYMLVIVVSGIGVYTGMLGTIGPITLDECQTRKADMEKLPYPFIGKGEKVIITCEPVEEPL